MTTLQLKVFRNDQLVETKTVDSNVIKIGRLGTSHLCLNDDTVARMHAVIEVSGSDVRVIDLGSAAGTNLNGRRVEKNAMLRSGDHLTLGSYRVEVGMQPTSAAAPQHSGSAALAPAPVTTAAPPRPTATIDPSEVERQDGSTVTEVMALYGKTVLDVQHVDQVRSKHKTAPGLMMLGGLLLLGGGALFAADVAQDWDGHRVAVQEATVSGRPAPTTPGTGFGGLGVVLALAGLVPFGLGSVRRSDKGLSAYTIGENPDATFHAPVLGTDDGQFPLVRGRKSGGSTLNFTEGMTGNVALEGRSLSLAELAASGRASRIGSSYRYPLPAGARCRINYGGLTFLVNSVAAGKAIARRSEADRPFWLYNAASLGAIGTLLVMTHLMPDDALAMSLDDKAGENRFVGFMHQPEDIPEEEAPVTGEESTDEAGGQGTRHAGDEGKMGNPTEKKKSGLYEMKGPKDVTPQLARRFDPDLRAREAGILGLIAQDSGHFLASPYGKEFAVGNGDEDVWGGLTGTEVGAAFGNGGFGLIGTGRGGGGTGEGTIGLGNVGLINKGGGGGETSGYGRGKGSGFGDRGKRRPKVRATKSVVRGAMDKDIIRRIVRNHINEVRHCYNQGLTRDPNLKGRVAVLFNIGPTGKVMRSTVQETSIKDRNVANCVASAVKRWRFPKPDRGGAVMVTYPFVLSPG